MTTTHGRTVALLPASPTPEADGMSPGKCSNPECQNGWTLTSSGEAKRCNVCGGPQAHATPDVHRPTPDPGDPPELGWIRLSDVEATSVNWLWPGWLPRGKLVVLEGDPGTGKSTLALDLAARLSTGRPMPDGAQLEGAESVVMLTAEDGLADTVRPRLEAAGGDANRVVIVTSVRDPEGAIRMPSIPGDVPAVASLVRTESAGLVVVDVLNAFLHGQVDSYKDQDVRKALAPLSAMAEETGCTVLVLRHLSKGGGTKAIYRGMGSIGIAGAARVVLLAGVDPSTEDRRVLACSKSNLGPEPTSLGYSLANDPAHGAGRIQWHGDSKHTSADLLATAEDDNDGALDQAKEFLLDVLGDGPIPTKDLSTKAKELQISDRTLKRARASLKVKSSPAAGGPRNGWMLSLPDPETPLDGMPEDRAEGDHPGDVGPKGAKGAIPSPLAPLAPLDDFCESFARSVGSEDQLERPR